MKLIRVGPPGQELPGLLLPDGRRLDASPITRDYTPEFFDQGGLAELAALSASDGADSLDPAERLGAPLVRPGKIICIGLNYSDHAAESGMELPEEPVLFFKATSAICGPNDDLVIPKGSEKTDWEVELAVVIGKRAHYASPEEAGDHVLGYCLHNDYSERAWQLERSGQWVKGKSADTYAPLGPFIATPDELVDPHSLGLWLKVNGKTKQESSTANLFFGIPTLISSVSQYMSLQPGDIISTGTPAGVGLGFDPPVYLKPGDVVELGIDGLGEQRQVARAYES